MATPEPETRRQPQGLFITLRALWAMVLAVIFTRLDLLVTELEEEAVRAAELAIAGAAALFAFSSAFFFANLFLVAAFWENYRLLVIGLIFGLYLVIGVAFLVWLRRLIASRPRLLNHTLSELKRDLEGLQSAMAPKKEPGK